MRLGSCSHVDVDTSRQVDLLLGLHGLKQHLLQPLILFVVDLANVHTSHLLDLVDKALFHQLELVYIDIILLLDEVLLGCLSPSWLLGLRVVQPRHHVSDKPLLVLSCGFVVPTWTTSRGTSSMPE